MNYLHINEETLTKLQTFNSVQEMDAAIKAHKKAHNLSDTDRSILDAISRYACKYKGVCYLSKQKIAKAAGFKSRITAIRACNRLEALGIIKQYETRRIKGDRRQSANIIVIMPVTPESDTKETPTKAINSSNTFLDTDSGQKPTQSEAKPSEDEMIKRSLRNAIPAPIYDALSPFFNGKDLYKVYGILLRAKAKINRFITLEEHHERYINAFYNAVRLRKAGRVHTSFDGLLYVSWQRVTSEISRKIAYINNENNTLRLFEEVVFHSD